MLASAALFGTTGTARALGPAAGPPSVGAVRIAIGGTVLLAYTMATGGFGRREWSRRDIAVSGVGVAAYQACFFSAVSLTGVAIGTIVAIGSAPAVTGLLAWGFRGERPDGRWAVATGLAVAGSALLVASGGSIGVDPLGVLLALGAGASYAVYTVSGKGLLDSGHEPTAVMAAAFSTGAILLGPLLVLADLDWLARPSGLAMALYLGILPTAVAYVLFARGLRRLAPATVATLTLAEPLTAAILGVVVLDERPSALAAVGGLLVLSGLVSLTVRLGPPG